ncbi:MAG: synthase subunit a [Gemmataceae bacterium]|nr:synthase subunit a [Gemmataceae bacterium]
MTLFGKATIDPFGHVVDNDHIEIFESLVVHIPSPLSKFLIFLLLAAVLVGAAVIWVAGKMQSGEPPRGRLWNLIESLIFFVRDKIARPGIGEAEADKYLPFLSTLFLFIFVCNLFGMIPFLPSPTAHIYVTGALAVIAFFVIHSGGVKEHGLGGYLKTFVPHVHLEGPAKLMGPFLIGGMAVLEYLTAFIRTVILAVRLFANMLAGHTVLFMILFFIKLVADPAYQIDVARGQDWMYWPVSAFSVVMVVALSLLELFIAGLQAFVFTFLTSIFIGLAKHPPH